MGFDPGPFELFELREIAIAAWDKTATIAVSVQGLFDSSASVEKWNPYRGRTLGAPVDFEAKVEVLRGKLPLWRPRD